MWFVFQIILFQQSLQQQEVFSHFNRIHACTDVSQQQWLQVGVVLFLNAYFAFLATILEGFPALNFFCACLHMPLYSWETVVDQILGPGQLCCKQNRWAFLLHLLQIGRMTRLRTNFCLARQPHLQGTSRNIVGLTCHSLGHTLMIHGLYGW